MTVSPGHLARSANDANGTRSLCRVWRWNERSQFYAADLGLHVRAGEGNRTLMTSLEGWGSAIELRPHVPGWRYLRHQVSIDSVPGFMGRPSRCTPREEARRRRA